MVTAAYALGLMDMRDPVDVEIFANEIDAKVAARVFNLAYLSGVHSAVVEGDPRGWVVRVYQYAHVGYLAPKPEAAA
jgi:hypothetical protein